MNVSDFDLNLLRVFEALYGERSVSRAAARLRLSQPAASNALGRLRRELGDPLFVRSREGMVPTTRATALWGPVSLALQQLQTALVETTGFDPSTATRTFILAASDHAQLLVLPRLMQAMAAHRGLKLRVVPLLRDFPSGELQSGEVDLVMGVFDLAPGDRAPRGLKRQLLARERFVLVGRKGNPALATTGRLDLARPQLHVAPRGGTQSAFERRTRLERNIVLFTPHYLVAPWVLSSTDLVAALPERVAARFAEAFPLAVLPISLPHTTLDVQQLWHPRRQEEAAHKWLRSAVLRAAQGSEPWLGDTAEGHPGPKRTSRRC